jgi:hypothetical protein
MAARMLTAAGGRGALAVLKLKILDLATHSM